MNFLPIILIISLLNSCIELEISAPSFPAITKHFGISAGTIGLTITFNLIGFCIASLVYGPLSDRLGRRKTMLIGNGILLIGAIGCVIAPSINWLLLSRFVQGIGAATSAVLVSAIIADVYASDRAATLYGIMNSIFTTLMALSPVLGGIINNYIGWRGNYAVVMLICLISWGLQYFKLIETISIKKFQSIHSILNEYRTLLSSSVFVSASILPSLLYASYLTFVSLAPFIYVREFGLDQMTYVLHQAIVIAIFAASSALSQKFTKTITRSRILYISCILIILGPTIMLIADTPILLTITMSLFVVGLAWLYPIIFAESMEIFPHLKGSSASLSMFIRYILCAVFTGSSSYLYKGELPHLAAVFLVTALVIVTLLYKFINKKLFSDDNVLDTGQYS